MCTYYSTYKNVTKLVPVFLLLYTVTVLSSEKTGLYNTMPLACSSRGLGFKVKVMPSKNSCPKKHFYLRQMLCLGDVNCYWQDKSSEQIKKKIRQIDRQTNNNMPQFIAPRALTIKKKLLVDLVNLLNSVLTLRK